MDRTTIEALISQAQRETETLLTTLRSIGAEASADSTLKRRAEGLAGTVERETRNTLPWFTRDLVEALRPKGATVEMEWVGRDTRGRYAEVIRRTASRVLLNMGHSTAWYNLGNGEEVGKERGHATRVRGYRWAVERWRLTKAAREQITALPIGATDVSRAYDQALQATP